MGLRQQCIGALDCGLADHVAHVVQEQVHQTQPPRAGHDLVAEEGAAAQKGGLLLVQRLPLPREPVVGAQEEAAGAAGRVGNGLHRLGPHALHHGLDQRARREVLAGAALGVFGVLLQQAFVEVTLGVGVHADPTFGVDHLHQTRQLGRVLDLVLRLEEDRPQHAALLAQLMQRRQVLRFQRRAGVAAQRRPVQAEGHLRRPVVGLFGVLVRHLQEQQIGQLLQVVAIAHAIVLQRVAEVPDLLNQGSGVHGAASK